MVRLNYLPRCRETGHEGDMQAFFKFISKHLVPTIVGTIGGIIAVCAPIAGAYSISQLPLPWEVFMAGGLFTFMAAVVLLLFSYHSSHPPIEVEAKPKQIEKKNPPDVDEPFGGRVLGASMTGPSMGLSVNTQQLPTPKRVDPETEHADKKKAKEALVPLAINFFDPAMKALGQLKCGARDLYLSPMKRNGAARNLFSRTIDYGPQKPASRHDYAGYHDLQLIDKVRQLNLYETEVAFYHTYIDYAENVKLAVSLIDECTPSHASQVENLQILYKTWRTAHDSFVEQQRTLNDEFLDLNTVGRLEKNVLQDVPEPNWEALTVVSR